MLIEKISIIIPVYNEEKTIAEIIKILEDIEFGRDKEIIIVNDGSSDETRNILNNYSRKHKIIHHERNQGKGAAVRTGLQEATGDYFIVQDADLEYDPNDIKLLIAKIEKDKAEAVFGSRRLGGYSRNPNAGWRYYWGGVFLSALTNLLYGTKITDEPTCYKMFSKEVFNKIELKATGFEFCPEITAKIAKQGIKICEVPISYHPRSKSEGKKIKHKDGLIAIWTLIKYRFIK